MTAMTKAAKMDMTVSLREARMVLERLMHVAGLNGGIVPSLRDCALYSAALGLGGFQELARHVEALRRAKPELVRIEDRSGVLCLVGNGQHAWLAADPIVDLGVEMMRRGLPASVLVTDFSEPAELRVAEGVARRYGARVSFVTEADGIHATVTAAGSDVPDILMEVIRHGLPVDAELWWRLFDFSDQALTPDSYLSRRHAGAIIVEADGRVVGRQDEDDTDLSLLAAGGDAAGLPANLDGSAQC